MSDRRIWMPDETCEPWQFESSVNAGNRDMGRLDIVSGLMGVIASVTTFMPGAGSKPENYLVILRGESVPTAVIPLDRMIILTGALAGVIETGGATGANVPGLTGTGTPITRPVRIVLAAGVYRVAYVNASGAALVALHGWTFPAVRRDRG